MLFRSNVATIEQDLGSESGDETKSITMVLNNIKGKNVVQESNLSSSSLNCHKEIQDEKRRIELFHVRIISNHTKIDTLFDSGSQANLISEYLVKKLKLETIGQKAET